MNIPYHPDSSILRSDRMATRAQSIDRWQSWTSKVISSHLRAGHWLEENVLELVDRKSGRVAHWLIFTQGVAFGAVCTQCHVINRNPCESLTGYHA